MMATHYFVNTAKTNALSAQASKATYRSAATLSPNRCTVLVSANCFRITWIGGKELERIGRRMTLQSANHRVKPEPYWVTYLCNFNFDVESQILVICTVVGCE
jgi:hypothetical protein